MNILILGSEGFIGSHLCDFFVTQHTVIGYDTSSNAIYSHNKTHYHSNLYTTLSSIFNTYTIDVCINAAGSANVGMSVQEPINDFTANALFTMQVLDAIRQHSAACKYLHISSAAVYGNPTTLPIAEYHTLAPISPYGYHKLIAEKISEEYAKLYNIKTAIIRPFSVYGPRLKKQLFWDIYNKATSSNTVQMFGTGNETRDFIYITDVVAIINAIITNSKFEFEIYNTASGHANTIGEVTALFCGMFATPKAIVFNTIIKQGDPLYWQANIEKIKQLYNQPMLPITSGLQKTYQWIVSQS